MTKDFLNFAKHCFYKPKTWFLGFFLIGMAGVNVLIAQEKFGLTTTNFGGISAAQLNPSATVNSKLYLDINLVGAGFFIENNFFYIHKENYKLSEFLHRNPILPSVGIHGEGLDYYQSVTKVDGFQRNDIMGPSFSIASGKFAFGFFTKATTVTSISNLPDDIAILMYEGLDYDSLYDIQNLSSNFNTETMGWGEAGINFSGIFSEHQRDRWSAGINIRRLFGYGSAFLKSSNIDYTLVNDTTIDIQNMNAEAGFSLPVNYETNLFPDAGNLFKGKGMAIDVGLMYEKKMNYPVRVHQDKFCSYEYEDYLYRIGFSLLDFGSLTYKRNAQVHGFSNVLKYWDEFDDLGFVNVNQVFANLSQEFNYNPAASLQSTSFKMALPAALSLQADYQYFQNWFLNTTFVLPVKISDIQLKRPGQAIVSLRYESRWYEFGIPFSIYDFQKPRFGLFGRIYFFSFGTEKLGGLFGFSDFTGLDFYFSIKYNILKGDCRRYKPERDCQHLKF